MFIITPLSSFVGFFYSVEKLRRSRKVSAEQRGRVTLTSGLYTIALGAFANMSFAENLGTGTFGNRFIGLGSRTLWALITTRLGLICR